MIIKRIYDYINNLDIENGYDLIIESEKYLVENSIYWSLRGDICYKVEEYSTAISCYKKSLELEKLNTYAIENLINAYNSICDFENEHLYLSMLNEIKSSFNTDKINDILSSRMINMSKEYTTEILANDIYIYIGSGRLLQDENIILLDEYIMKDLTENIIVIHDSNYVENINYLAKNDIKNCIVVSSIYEKLAAVVIDEELMNYIKDGRYKNTITMNMYNNADSNVYALNKYIPEKYKNKYDINAIKGTRILEIDNIVKVPLMSRFTISGHGIFLSYPYPELTYNLEVGHGHMSLKSSGNMEKVHKRFAFSPEAYKNIDKICVSSHMDKTLWASFVNAPEDKFLVSGLPRTDTLLGSNGKENLEKLIKTKIDNKKVIFNMPTFHKHENSGKIDGNSKLNNFMKVHEFNYKAFDEFLSENNFICVMKAHHAEEKLLKSKEFKAENIYFIFNDDLEKYNLDLYEILNGADLLITDYSTIYSDFIFMNKPTVFVNTDIEEYRQQRGIALEPYDFWTAGPKVQSQKDLQNELVKSLTDENYYKQKREDLRPVYYLNVDNKASERVWEFIDDIMCKLNARL